MCKQVRQEIELEIFQLAGFLNIDSDIQLRAWCAQRAALWVSMLAL